MARNATRWVIACTLLASFVSAGGCDVATSWEASNWKVLAILGLAVSSAAVALYYVLGKAFDKPEMISTAKTDAHQIVSTAVFLIIFGSFTTAMCAVDVSSLFEEARGNFFELAEKYFEYSRLTALEALTRGTEAVMYISAASSVFAGGPVPWVLKLWEERLAGLSFAPWSGARVTIPAIVWGMNLILLSTSVQTASAFLLKIIENAFLNILLPAGVVLRCFTPTRDFGGVLIAIAIGLYLIYPALFAVFYIAKGAPTRDVPSISPARWWGELILIVATMSAVCMFSGLSCLVPALLGGVRVSYVTADYVQKFFISMGEAILYIFIVPAIVWIFIAVFVRELSKLLGEEVDISTLARMI